MTRLICVDSRPLLCSLNELIEGRSYYIEEEMIDEFSGQTRYLLTGLCCSYPAHLFLTEAEDKMMTDLIFETLKTPII